MCLLTTTHEGHVLPCVLHETIKTNEVFDANTSIDLYVCSMFPEDFGHFWVYYSFHLALRLLESGGTSDCISNVCAIKPKIVGSFSLSAVDQPLRANKQAKEMPTT